MNIEEKQNTTHELIKVYNVRTRRTAFPEPEPEPTDALLSGLSPKKNTVNLSKRSLLAPWWRNSK